MVGGGGGGERAEVRGARGTIDALPPPPPPPNNNKKRNSAKILQNVDNMGVGTHFGCFSSGEVK